MNTVDSVLNRNFRAEAEKRGYIVVAPAAPDDQLFFEDGARIFPEFLKTDPGGLQDPRQQVPYRRTIQRRNRRIPRRGRESSVLFVRYRLPWIYVGAQPGQAPGYFEDVRLHVRRRERRIHVAPGDEEGSRIAALSRDGRPLYRRERPAAPDGNAGRRQCRTLVRRI